MTIGELRRLIEPLTDEAEVNVYKSEWIYDGDDNWDDMGGSVPAKAELRVFEGSVYLFLEPV